MNQPSANANKRISRAVSRALLLCAAASVLAAAGCGSAAYAEKFNQRLEQLKTSSTFSAVLTDQPTEGLPINFRIPKELKKAYTAISADDENGNRRIMHQRFAPAVLMDFPGEQLMFEGQTVGKENKAAFYLYLGEGDVAEVKGKFPYEEWRDRLKRGRMTPGAWEDVDVRTPKGAKLKWKRLTATGKHAWDITPNKTNITGYPSVDTFFQMWVYETPQTIAILGWWSTDDDRAMAQQAAELTAGTAVVSPIAPAAPSAPAKGK